MSYLTMFDSVVVENIPSSARYVALYVDGGFANVGSGKLHCPHADVLTITVTGANPADCCDCEAGDMTPAQAETWVARRLAAGAYRPCVYASQNTWESGLSRALAVYGGRVRRWTAAYPGIGAAVPAGYDAHQYSDGGGKLDTSVCLTDFFDPPAPPVRWASAEIQSSIPVGSHGVLRFNGSFDADSGAWSIHGSPGSVQWSGPGGGKWRVKGMPWNAGPLGG